METIRGCFDSLHFGTRFLMISMIVIAIIQFALLDKYLVAFLTFSPSAIVQQGQVWRLITGTYMHTGIFHLAINMMSFAFLGTTLELALGTLSYFCHIFIFGIISCLVHIAIAYLLYAGGRPTEVHTQALGFSGVLFSLIVIDIHLSGGDQRSVFGLFLVPSWAYPWVMLLVMSLLIQGVSFWGHFAGLVVGYLYKFGIMSYVIPSVERFRAFEQRCCCCQNRLGYVRAGTEHRGPGQPFAVFQRVFRDNDEAEEPQPGQPRFGGRGRTVGQGSPPPATGNGVHTDAPDAHA
jgi:membrane associated rhomboid family serine protease